MTNRILRINSCDNCDPYRINDNKGDFWCKKGRTGRVHIMTHNLINDYIGTKTLPDNCPLDSLDSLIAPIKKIWKEVMKHSMLIGGEDVVAYYMSNRLLQAIKETLKLTKEIEK